MQFKRKIRLFFASYGPFIFTVAFVIFIIIFIIQNEKNYVKEENKKNEIPQEQIIEIEKNKQREKEEKKLITQYVDYCINNQKEQAYNMLSNKCKTEKYKTIELFEENFINIFFKIKICDYEIKTENGFYTVILTEDMLITGQTNKTRQIILKVDENKIYIDL